MNHQAQGMGFALAQVKVTHTDGSVDYHYSLPDAPWWALRRRLHRRLLLAWARMNLEG